MGFKKSNEYNVDELPGANSAFYGFIKNELGDSDDYEIRMLYTAITRAKKQLLVITNKEEDF